MKLDKQRSARPTTDTAYGPAKSRPLPTWFWPALLIVAATVVAYWPVFSAGFIWDDDAYVTNNPLLTASDGLQRIWFSAHAQSQYFPLVYTTLRIEYGLWALNPVGYHIVNVCFHIANALLIWALLRRLKLPGAWLAAAVFALHPVQVETVAWVTELKNTESTLFYLLTIFAWLHFCAGRGRKYYVLALGLQALALFAKTTACTLPAALLLALWLKNEPVTRRRILQTLPFLALGIGMGLLSVWWEGHLGNYKSSLHLLGGPLDRLLIATHALWFYAGKVFWPTNLTFSYPHWNINPQDWLQYLWLVACLAVAVALWLWRKRLGRAPAAVFFFAAALSPMLGFIPLYTFYYSYVADHYQYLACLGLIALACVAAAQFCEKRPALKRLQPALAGALLFVLAMLTWRQCGIYQTPEKLWVDTISKNPRSWLAHTNLGRLLAQEGDLADAETNYQTALNLNPDEAAIHFNYGNLLARAHRVDAAASQFRTAIQLAPEKADAHNNLGSILMQQHQTADAAAEFKQAIFCDPDYADAYFNLGSALLAEHQTADAVEAYRQAARLKPNSELFQKRLQTLGVSPN